MAGTYRYYDVSVGENMTESINKSVNVNFRCTETLRARFYEACRKTGNNPSEELREFMSSFSDVTLGLVLNDWHGSPTDG